MVGIVDKHIYLWMQPEYRGFVHIHVWLSMSVFMSASSIHYDSLISSSPVRFNKYLC